MKNVFKTVLIVIGILLVINGCIIALVANFNIGCIMTFALGLFLAAYGIVCEKIRIKWVHYMIGIVLTGVVILSMMLATVGNNDNVTYTEDAVIVLGAGIKGEAPTLPLVRRLDKAVEYHKKNPEAVIVVSGGKGAQEYISEALAMERYLIKQGVPENKILSEDMSTSTYENFVYSKSVLEKYFKGTSYKTAFITNDFHVYRANEIAKIAGFKNAAHLHGKTEWYTLSVNYLRECVAVLKLWIFRR